MKRRAKKRKPALRIGQSPKKKGKATTYESEWKNGHCHNYVSPLYGMNRKISGAVGLTVDITKAKKSEKEVKQKRRMLDSLMNNLPGVAYRCLHDSNWTMMYVSKGCFKLTGYRSVELINNTEKSFAEIVHPDDRSKGRNEIRKALRNRRSFEIEYRIISKTGKNKWVWEKGEGVYSDEGKLLFLEGFITDITRQKESEQALAQSRENYKSLVEYSPYGIFIHNQKGEVIFANKSALKIVGIRSITELNNKTVFHYILPEYHDDVRKRRVLLEKGKNLNFMTTRLRKNDGAIIEVESKPIKCMYEGIECVLVVYHDISYQRQLERKIDKAQILEQINRKLQREISERKKAEEKTQASLKEKEALLKELHHRVKNNLQVISSILNLQSSYVKDPHTLNVLKESQNRIKSMAFIHESLYQTRDLSHINFTEYSNNLTTNLVHSYSNDETKVDLILSAGNIFLNMEIAIPCGLIINELVSNSYKYAFKGRREGKIWVSIEEKNECYRLQIRDNGVGLPAPIDIKNTESLGLQLVATLSEQIGGTLEMENKNGTNFKIEFPKTKSK